MPHDDFAVRSKVDQRPQRPAFVEPGGEDAGEDVAADETAEARQKPDHHTGEVRPPQFVTPEDHFSQLRRLERGVRQRRRIQTGEQMVHGGVPHQNHFLHRRRAGRLRAQFGQQSAKLLPDKVTQHERAAFLRGEVDPAHDVGAVNGLLIQSRAHRQHTTVRAVQQLQRQRRRTQVDRHPEPPLRRERDGGIIAQDGGLPLGHLEGQIPGHTRPATEPPAIRHLPGGEQSPVRFAGRQFTLRHPHPAPFATALAAAGKLDPVGEQRLAQPGPRRQFEDPVQRKQRNPMI